VAVSTFQELYRSIQLVAPDVPLPLAQQFINNAGKRIYDSARWSGLRAQSSFIIPVGVTSDVVATVQGTSTVSAPAGTWTSAVVGWQFFVDNQAPFYTVTEFSTNGIQDVLFLDRPYAGESTPNAVTSVQLLYLPVAADFLHFIDVLDVVNQWRMRTGPLVEDLDIWDPARTYSGTPWVFAQIEPTTLGGRPRFEIYPRPDITTAHTYPYRYQRRVAELSAASDVPAYPIRAQTLREGALAELARWPGTQARPNPYFSLDLSAFHEKQFNDALARDMREDQEINQTDVQYPALYNGGWGWGAWPLAPFSASFMQNHLFYGWGGW
jgi:hypothetical protein